MTPNLEVVVVDPNSFYSSEEEDSDDDDKAVKKSNENLNSEESTLKPTEAQTTESPINDTVSSANEKPEGSPIEEQRVELIDGLFDFVTIEEEDPLLQGMDLFQNSERFDLASYITDESEELMSSPPSSIEPTSIKTTEDNHESHAIIHPVILNQAPVIKAQNTKITFEYYGERKCMKREFLGDSSDSEDDCKKTKKRKINEDPVWMPPGKPKSKPMNKLARTTTDNRKSDADNKGSHLNGMPKCPAKNEKFAEVALGVENTNTFKFNGIRYGIGRGKDISTLTKYYKRKTSIDTNNNNNETDKKSLNIIDRLAEQSIQREKTSTKNLNPMKKQTPEQNGKISESHSRIHKAQESHKKLKDSVEKMSKNADLSDFARVIVASMVASPKRKPDLTKRTNSPKQIQQNYFKEHPAQHKMELIRKASQSGQPFKIQESVQHIPVLSSKPLITGSVDNMKLRKLSDQQPNITTDGCGTNEKGEQPMEKVEIAMVSSPNDTSDSNKTSNSTMKRKITVAEYLKRKAVQSA